MTPRSLVISLLAAGLGLGSPARALVIDDFTDPQVLSGPAASGLQVNSVVFGDMFGGFRSMDVGGVLPAFSMTATAGGGTLTLTQSAPGQRFVDLTWARSNPINLTGGGAFSAFQIDVSSFSGVTFLSLSIFSESPTRSRASRTLSATGPLLIDFSEFDDEVTDTADITNVFRIFLRVQTTGDVVLGAISTVPEPRVGALLAACAGALALRHVARSRSACSSA